MTSDAPFDYLAIGHISRDIVPPAIAPAGYTLGGTVAFSGRVAHALGCRTAVLTSVGPALDAAAALPDCTVAVVPAAASTAFENIYTPTGRRQIVHMVAAPLTVDDLPPTWRNIPIVHLGPITPQVDPQLVCAFPNSVIGLTPQGWMRAWDADGVVRPIALPHAALLLPRADAVIIGEEDLHAPDELERLRALSRLLVMTRSARGCTVFHAGAVYDVPAPVVVEVNPTGAGDIFATAFLVRLQRSGGDFLAAAAFANAIAAASVAAPTLAAKIRVINARMREYG